MHPIYRDLQLYPNLILELITYLGTNSLVLPLTLYYMYSMDVVVMNMQVRQIN
jgi:hypothetical protein